MWTTARSTASASGRRIRSSWKGAGRSASRTPALLEQLMDQIRKDGYLRRPVLVADGELVILDGHHRVEAIRALGARRIPAYLIDYFSDIVRLSTWPDAEVSVVTKEDVIRRGRTGDLFPPKTSRHTVTVS